MAGNMVEAVKFEDEFTAKIAKSRLEALGIEAIIAREEQEEAPISGSYNLEISLFVREEDLIVAKEILEEAAEGHDLFPDNDG